MPAGKRTLRESGCNNTKKKRLRLGYFLEESHLVMLVWLVNINGVGIETTTTTGKFNECVAVFLCFILSSHILTSCLVSVFHGASPLERRVTWQEEQQQEQRASNINPFAFVDNKESNNSNLIGFLFPYRVTSFDTHAHLQLLVVVVQVTTTINLFSLSPSTVSKNNTP